MTIFLSRNLFALRYVSLILALLLWVFHNFSIAQTCPSSISTSGSACSISSGTLTITSDGQIANTTGTATLTIPALSDVTAINNYGTLSATSSRVIKKDGGTLGTLTNSGTITESGNYYTISNTGGTIGTFTNSGNITSSGTTATIYNSATITTINNTATGRISSAQNVIYSTGGTITSIINSGVMTSSGTTYPTIVNDNSGTISNIINTASGSIEGVSYGIWNRIGTIQALTNDGLISSSANTGVVNAAGSTISTFNNRQGASSSALTYSGPLPTNYNIIARSLSNYGKLAVTSPSGATTFGIYGGGVNDVAASSLNKGTYSSVLTGISSSNLTGATSGNYSGFTWYLNNPSSTTWDLIVTGASTVDTQQSLVNTALVLQGTYTLQNTVMVNGLTYDCPLFDEHGICVSAGGRNTSVQSQGINNTSGLLIASYRLDANNTRIGAWVDNNLSVSGPSTVQLGNSMPMIGLFGVWSERPDGVGAQVKVSAAYGQKGAAITRQITGTSEAGSGGSQLISQGAQVVAKYGFSVLPNVIASPYAGIRYTQNNMGGYTEATNTAVTAPLTYSALNTNATTAIAGAEASYRGIPKATLFASAGVETDTNTSNGSYSATGIVGLTSVNFNPSPVATRPTATVGAYYDILNNQRIGIAGIYRQEPFQAVSTATVLATYAIGL